MNVRRNYQKELERIIENNQREDKIPSLLLHSCCAPCSSYVLEYLSSYFKITVFYYNPNIYPPEEYSDRVEEQKRLIEEMSFVNPVEFLEGEYKSADFYQAVKGHERDEEGGERCLLCYELRLREAAQIGAQGGFDYFTTTLSISPLKNAEKLNKIGEEMGKRYNLTYLNSDFKKKNGYKRSTELSKEYDLYRQNYCGCIYSMSDIKQENRE